MYSPQPLSVSLALWGCLLVFTIITYRLTSHHRSDADLRLTSRAASTLSLLIPIGFLYRDGLAVLPGLFITVAVAAAVAALSDYWNRQ